MNRNRWWPALLLVLWGARAQAQDQAQDQTAQGQPAQGSASADAGAGGDEGIDRNNAAVEAMSDQQAKSHFRVGGALYDEGRFREAAEEFEKAYELSRKPELLFNMYIAYRDAGSTEKAVDALRRYLAEAQKVPDRQQLEARLAAMEQTLKTWEDNQKAEAAAQGQAQPPPAQTPAPAPEAAAAQPHAERSRLGPWIVAGTGAAALLTATVTGIVALQKTSDIDGACPNHLCPAGFPLDQRRAQARKWVRATDALWPIGLAATTTGVILLFVMRDDAPTREAPVQASAGCAPGGCAGELRVRF